jgi:hypothetical protein
MLQARRLQNILIQAVVNSLTLERLLGLLLPKLEHSLCHLKMMMCESENHPITDFSTQTGVNYPLNTTFDQLEISDVGADLENTQTCKPFLY